MGVAKFATCTYWKKKGDCCDFIEVVRVINDDGERSRLVVNLHTQRHTGWATLVRGFEYLVNRNEYGKWNQFVPRGDHES